MQLLHSDGGGTGITAPVGLMMICSIICYTNLTTKYFVFSFCIPNGMDWQHCLSDFGPPAPVPLLLFKKINFVLSFCILTGDGLATLLQWDFWSSRASSSCSKVGTPPSSTLTKRLIKLN